MGHRNVREGRECGLEDCKLLRTGRLNWFAGRSGARLRLRGRTHHFPDVSAHQNSTPDDDDHEQPFRAFLCFDCHGIYPDRALGASAGMSGRGDGSVAITKAIAVTGRQVRSRCATAISLSTLSFGSCSLALGGTSHVAATPAAVLLARTVIEGSRAIGMGLADPARVVAICTRCPHLFRARLVAPVARPPR